MKASSLDLREKVLRAVDQGYPREEIVKLLGVSSATIKRDVKQRRETGTVAPKAIPGRPPQKLGPLQAELVAQLRAHEDLRLEDHCHWWEQTHGVKVSTATMSRAIKRLGWTRKKNRWREVERREEERAAWREQVKTLNVDQFVFVDEGGSNSALTPLYARAPKGQRAYGSVPRNRGANTTLLASLSREGMGEAMMLEGAADTVAFEVYLEQVLAPSLSAGQIVVMDTLSIHTGEHVRQVLSDRGCSLLFLPADSPDLSPIEEAFSKLKAYLRRVGARTREALEEAIAQALTTITAQDARGWFQHCGYLPAVQPDEKGE